MRFSCFGLDGDIINKPIYRKEDYENGDYTIRNREKPLAKGYDIDGYDEKGFNKEGFNREGFDKDGFDWLGYDKDGFNEKGWNEENINKSTGTKYDKDGFARYGYDKNGFDRNGKSKSHIINKSSENQKNKNIKGDKLKKKGLRGNGNKYDRRGFDVNGYNKYTKTNFDKDGYDLRGFGKDGYNRDGFNIKGINKYTGTRFDKKGFDISGKYKTPRDYTNFTFDVLLAGYYLHGLGTYQTFYVSWTIPTGEIRAFHIHEDYGKGISSFVNFGPIYNPYKDQELLDKLKKFNSEFFSGLREGEMPRTNSHTGYIININPILFQYRMQNTDIIFKLEELQKEYTISYKMRRRIWKEDIFPIILKDEGFVDMCRYNDVTKLCSHRNDIFLLDVDINNGFGKQKRIETLEGVSEYVYNTIYYITERRPFNGTWILPNVYRSEY